MTTRWAPRVTVAAIAGRCAKMHGNKTAETEFLLVEEHTSVGLRLNNPAGHLEPGESPLDAVSREALEETTRCFTPRYLIGLYMTRCQISHPPEDVTYLRLAFGGDFSEANPQLCLDSGIERTVWMTLTQLRNCPERLRTPLVVRCIEDMLAGQRHPLSVLSVDASVFSPPSPSTV